MTMIIIDGESRLYNGQIPAELPAGLLVMVRSSWETGRLTDPIVSSTENQFYWEASGYVPLPPPPGGMVWVSRGSWEGICRVGALPELPDGESYQVIPGGSGYYAERLAVPPWCFSHPTRHRAESPSVYLCPRFCVHPDGCSECNENEYQRCASSGCTGDNYFRVPVSAEHCLCATDCAQCLEWFPESSMYTVNSGEMVCDHCVSQFYTECDGCDAYIADDEYRDHREDCRSVVNVGLIQDYSYTPYLNFHGKGQYHLGLELELNTGRCDTEDAAQEIAAHFGNLVYLKEDSSIDDGFEMVTHPMTLAYAKSIDWSILDRLREGMGLRGSSDCGMHVHVSKTAFDTTSHTYRWMRLIYRNAEPIQALARRRGSTYASFRSHMNDWAIHYAAVSKTDGHASQPAADAWYLKTPGALARTRKVGLPYGTQRYAAINVENEKTFELRFFASTTRANRVLAALEFVSASIEYTRQLTAHQAVAQKGLNFSVFTAWVKDNNPDGCYANLISEIERLVP